MRGRRGRSGTEAGGEGDHNEQAANAKGSTEQSAKQDAEVNGFEKLSATAEEDASEEEAQIERVIPDADSEADQRLDQPTACGTKPVVITAEYQGWRRPYFHNQILNPRTFSMRDRGSL